MTDISYICPKAGQKNKTKQTQKKHIIAVGGGVGGGGKENDKLHRYVWITHLHMQIGRRAGWLKAVVTEFVMTRSPS